MFCGWEWLGLEYAGVSVISASSSDSSLVSSDDRVLDAGAFAVAFETGIVVVDVLHTVPESLSMLTAGTVKTVSLSSELATMCPYDTSDSESVHRVPQSPQSMALSRDTALGICGFQVNAYTKDFQRKSLLFFLLVQQCISCSVYPSQIHRRKIGQEMSYRR
jgi:hypothetical protein